MEDPSMPQHNALRVKFLSQGAFWWRRWRGRCWGTRKAAGNHAAMEHSENLFLGVVASGIGFTFMWNYGATRWAGRWVS